MFRLLRLACVSLVSVFAVELFVPLDCAVEVDIRFLLACFTLRLVRSFCSLSFTFFFVMVSPLLRRYYASVKFISQQIYCMVQLFENFFS